MIGGPRNMLDQETIKPRSRMGIKQGAFRRRAWPKHNFDTRPAKKFFVFVQSGAVVEVTQNADMISRIQMCVYPPPQPQALCQLLAPVLD